MSYLPSEYFSRLSTFTADAEGRVTSVAGPVAVKSLKGGRESVHLPSVSTNYYNGIVIAELGKIGCRGSWRDRADPTVNLLHQGDVGATLTCAKCRAAFDHALATENERRERDRLSEGDPLARREAAVAAVMALAHADPDVLRLLCNSTVKWGAGTEASLDYDALRVALHAGVGAES